MPNWGQVLQEMQALSRDHGAIAIDLVRRKYLSKLHQHTGRNVIAYYSGFLSKPSVWGMEINDEDKNGFMMAVHGMDKARGLDLILHTPGGSIASTQSIVDYLHKIFDRDIRAFIPQIAMSAGTMMACSCREIWMGKHSNLGPIDPQVNGIPAYGVLSEFRRACREMKQDPAMVEVWGRIISQYRPTFLGRCENAIKWSNEFVEQQLQKVMFASHPRRKALSQAIVKKLSHYDTNRTHERHIHMEECIEMGLNVRSLESSGEELLQDSILTIHHCFIHSVMNTNAFKIIENHNGAAFVKSTASKSQ